MNSENSTQSQNIEGKINEIDSKKCNICKNVLPESTQDHHGHMNSGLCYDCYINPPITVAEIYSSEINATHALLNLKRSLERSVQDVEYALQNIEENQKISSKERVNYLDCYDAMKDLVHDWSSLRGDQNYAIVDYLDSLKKFQNLAEKYSTQLGESS